MSINTTSISIKKLHEEAYQLGIQFFEPCGKLNSSKEFIFKHVNKLKEKELLDIYSLNCSYKKNDSNQIFNKRDLKSLKKVAKKIELSDSFSCVITVDVKGSVHGYLDQGIAEFEKEICQVFVPKAACLAKNAKKSAELLQNKLDFIFCEGTLKASLLQKFDDSQIEYLNSQKGAKDFCVLTEVFMNGAKFGHENSAIDATQFVEPISKKSGFHPYKISTIWYPELYKESSKEVAALFQPVFLTNLTFEQETGITEMTLKEVV